MIFKEVAQDSAYSHPHGYDLLQLKDIEQKQRERCKGWSPGETRYKPPVKSHMMHLIFPAANFCDKHVKCCQSGKLVRDSVPNVFIGD